MDEYIEEIACGVNKLKGVIPKSITPNLMQERYRIPLKIVWIRDLIIHRVVHLSEEALEAYYKHSTITFALLVRATIEAAALMFSLDKHINNALANKDIKSLEEILHRHTIGSKNKSTPVAVVNSLTCLEKLDKKYSGIKKHYDDLSEYCHPNFSGLFMTYGQITKEGKINFGRYEDPGIKIGIVPLRNAILIASFYYDSIREKNNEILINEQST